QAISEQYIMDLSHMGFVAGLMEEISLPYAKQKAVLSCISEKNTHGIRSICADAGVSEEMIGRLEALSALYGSLEGTLEQAKALCCNEKMEQAVEELENILHCLKIGGHEKNVNLDFSIVNDMDYYTGIIFQGFIQGVPSGILSGGRYDNLLQKMGKDADAIGFAVYLDLLERFETAEREYDVDTLLLYEEGVDTAALAKAAQMLTDNGQSVLVQKKNTGNVKYKQLLCMKDRGLEIVAELD
ncbi:MAG: ATP phosphoribosyltransferase regulatory subunit, partial [Bacillota bacterium]|nr:ATP phosphoribosyltransferase regulatory subunit [Bacillota bacterium]